MYYHTHQLAPVRLHELIGIGSYRIKRYDYIARYDMAVGIIERDDVGIVIMIEKLSVDLQNLSSVQKR